MPKKPDKLLLPGQVICRACKQPHPSYIRNAPLGICSGCYALVEIDRKMTIHEYQRREMYTFAAGDPPGGHAIKKPKTGLPHLDISPRRICDHGAVVFGGRQPDWVDDDDEIAG